MTDLIHHDSGLRIDAHHHLWHYTPDEYDWLQGDLQVLQRDHLADELLREMHVANVSGAVAVQARQTMAETDWLLQTAEQHAAMLGVVGWLPIASDEFPELLERYAARGRLKGLRHLVQAEPDGFLDSVAFNHGMQRLAGTGLVYDILIHQHQVPEAIRFVDRHPAQSFVLDHLGKPRIAAGELQPWAEHLRELARRPHVTCKVSGMVTEAARDWLPDDLKRFFEVVLEAFTPGRLMVGTDWPVLTPRCSYSRWWKLVEGWAAALSADERHDLMVGTAVRAYRLRLPETAAM